MFVQLWIEWLKLLNNRTHYNGGPWTGEYHLRLIYDFFEGWPLEKRGASIIRKLVGGLVLLRNELLQ